MNTLAPHALADSEEATRRWLADLAHAAVAAVHPDALLSENLLTEHLPSPSRGRTVVVGAGKAAAAMAVALERAWRQHFPEASLEGLVVTRYAHGVEGHDAESGRIEVLEAAHPMPDNLGQQAAKRMLEAVTGLGEEDRVIALISGGGSALMSLPAAGVSLAEKQAINHALLRCGAPIREINTVRRHLSAIKGGRLAVAAHPAQVVTYLISDVPGDDPTLVASGPTLPDTTSPHDALAILERYAIEVPEAVHRHLADATDAPQADSAEFSRDVSQVLAKASDALAAGRNWAERSGVQVRLLGDDLEGEARDLGRAQGRLALTAQGEIEAPLLLLSGGETSVTVQGDGRGGRNVEYLLGLFDTLKGAEGIYALAIDTDGIDGSEDNAGALLVPEDWAQAEKLKLVPGEYLSRNDAYTFFQKLERLIVTGPTRTNVNDFRAILVLPRRV